MTIERPVDELEDLWSAPRARERFLAGAPDPGIPAFTRAPAGRGTELRVSAESANERDVREALRRFKRLAETGEIATTESQPAGERSPVGWLMAGRSEGSGR